jgi:outer membrane protein OmpA-like peptidoglycan-associated protein
VLFDTASSNLKPGAREKLARVAGILASHPDLHIDIEGHTDSVGGDEYNQGLSERRADSVRAYLVQQKVSPSVVGTAGFGESKPVASNGTSAGRQQNRRVEIVVTGESIGR